MATGYTECIGKGISFPDFVLRCAHAFGACIAMREDSLDKPIPEKFKASTKYYDDNIVRMNAELRYLESITDDEAKEKSKQEWNAEMKRIEDLALKEIELKKKYEEMLAQVMEWIPPSPDHSELKKFMFEQIRDSIECDCDYYSKMKDQCPVKLSSMEWKTQKIEKINHDLIYYNEELQQELERTEQRNLWIRQLRNSLKEPPDRLDRMVVVKE